MAVSTVARRWRRHRHRPVLVRAERAKAAQKLAGHMVIQSVGAYHQSARAASVVRAAADELASPATQLTVDTVAMTISERTQHGV
jgi:hypothetical protein